MKITVKGRERLKSRKPKMSGGNVCRDASGNAVMVSKQRPGKVKHQHTFKGHNCIMEARACEAELRHEGLWVDREVAL